MYHILEIIFGKVLVNKLRIKVGNTKRNPFTQLAISFKENYLKEWKVRTEVGQFVLVLIPLLNLFIFSGIFSFIIVLSIDFFFVRYILNRN